MEDEKRPGRKTVAGTRTGTRISIRVAGIATSYSAWRGGGGRGQALMQTTRRREGTALEMERRKWRIDLISDIEGNLASRDSGTTSSLLPFPFLKRTHSHAQRSVCV